VSEEAARLLVDEHGFTIEDAFIFLSVACDAGVAQACKPAEGFGTIALLHPKNRRLPRAVRDIAQRVGDRVDRLSSLRMRNEETMGAGALGLRGVRRGVEPLKAGWV
jgi:hypothetical protein